MAKHDKRNWCDKHNTFHRCNLDSKKKAGSSVNAKI